MSPSLHLLACLGFASVWRTAPLARVVLHSAQAANTASSSLDLEHRSMSALKEVKYFGLWILCYVLVLDFQWPVAESVLDGVRVDVSMPTQLFFVSYLFVNQP